MLLKSIQVVLGVCAVKALTAEARKLTKCAEDDPTKLLKGLNDDALKALQDAGGNDGECTLENAMQRQDWADMSSDARKDYIKAVECLHKLPAKSTSFAAGARNRYDDFVAVHIDQTLQIHQTGNFLTWHRYFTWLYEKALRDECGYKGAQPYWNWFESVDDITKSSVFDGSDTSMGGDGEFFQHDGTAAGPPGQPINLPSGKGGGCLKSGPFSDVVANLGPIMPAMQGYTPIAPSQYAYNPRCLKRDLTSYATKNWMTADNLLNITVGDASGSVSNFQDELQGRFGNGFLGMHSAGHFAAGGDASDFFTSTNDPSFFLHHAMVDKLYWIWQSLHLEKASQIGGTITMFNQPPSRDAVSSDPLEMRVLGEQITIGGALDTLAGKFCYIYV